MAFVLGYDINTGDLAKWAESIEKEGDKIGSQMMLKVKRKMESDRKLGKTRFARIKRHRSSHGNVKPLILQRGPVEKNSKSFAAVFQDVFKGSFDGN